jgi:hypothetical protein
VAVAPRRLDAARAGARARTSAHEIRRATGQLRFTLGFSLHELRRVELIEREHRPGADHWLATPAGTRLGVVPYVVRLLGAIKPLYRERRPSRSAASTLPPRSKRSSNWPQVATRWCARPAVRSLGRLHARAAIPTLEDLLRSYPSESVRAAAASALGRIGERSAIKALADALAGRDRGVGRNARHALIELGAVRALHESSLRLEPLRSIDAVRARIASK